MPQTKATPLVDLFMQIYRKHKLQKTNDKTKKPAEQVSNFKKADLHEKQTTTK
jgi:hypothetical protein